MSASGRQFKHTAQSVNASHFLHFAILQIFILKLSLNIADNVLLFRVKCAITAGEFSHSSSLLNHFVFPLLPTDIHNIPKTELVADNCGGHVSKTVITNCSPSSVVEHFQTSFTAVPISSNQPHCIMTDSSYGTCTVIVHVHMYRFESYT